ncbi:putative repeat protein (TIGR01451 family) [Variovorax sp. 54]|uniref:prealbumin-like fold domain-containing protein n=1 Tax=Variovorax sp. 54 TaxID=2035212 RepID=UPI000C3F9EF7|nr:hypothetical protein [Variovorax sp. 54]PIF73223.1 putative repeat protein (TIGR01451 family) [Variovorax sp. 54]
MLLLAGVPAIAADFCVNPGSPSTVYGGVIFSTAGSGCDPRFPVTLGNDGVTESCTFKFSVPVSQVYFDVGSLGCLSSGCEKVVTSVDGQHYPFTAASVTTPSPILGGSVTSIVEPGDILGATSPDGTARARISAAAVSSVTLTHEIVSGVSDGAAYRLCFSTPPPQLALSKTASPARFTVGKPATYRLTLSSTNSVATTAVTTISDSIPATLTVGTVPAGCTKSGQVVTCTVPAGSLGSKSFDIPVTPLPFAVPSVANTATASGGGDAACIDAGACRSSVTTLVDPLPAIATKKSASANPLLVGASNQFYTVEITVSTAATTAPITLADTLPVGITLAGAPTLNAGTTTGAVLTGCLSAGSSAGGCSIGIGVTPGVLSLRIPVNVAATAVGATGGTNTVNLSGGGDPSCTSAAGEICDATTVPVRVILSVPKVQIVKRVASGTGSSLFSFALAGLSKASDSIVVAGATSATGAPGIVGTAGVGASITESSPAGWPANPVSASCVDVASATSALTFGTLTGNVLEIPAARMVAGADIQCTFVNSVGFALAGRVFNDNGFGSGVPNDGLVNGGEKGLDGVAVRLTDCAAAIFSTATTDGLGNYSLPVPSSMAMGAALCVEESTPAGYLSTGASVGATQLPSGASTSSGGKAYTYTRTAAGTPDRMAFSWNGASSTGLNFGDVPFNTFGADSVKGGVSGGNVNHAHIFTAQTGGSVSFDIVSQVATPPVEGWSARVLADPGCTGVPQAGAAVLYPPAVAMTVTAGQNVCVVLQTFVPGSATDGHRNDATVQANFVFTNASPGLNASFAVHDTTTMSIMALELKKEVRNVTQDGAFGLNNLAKSGETLEYRITYTNNGATPISNLTLNDATPVYTSFAGSEADTPPATLTACAKNTPANPVPAPSVLCTATQAVGGVGSMDWKFTGQLAPGGTGAVRFRVTVN